MAYEYDRNKGFYDNDPSRREHGYRNDYGAGRPPVRPPHKNDSDAGAWILIAVMFAIGLWPIGLILLISKLSDTAQRNQKTISRTYENVKQDVKAAAGTVRQSAVQRMTKTPTFSAKGARIMRIVGLVMAFLGAMAAVSALAPVVSGGFALSWELLSQLFYPAGFLSGGIALMIGSTSMKRRARRFGTYLACAGNKEAVSLELLSQAAGVSRSKAEKDVEMMLEKGLWGKSAFMDSRSGMLFRSPASADAYKQAREAPAAPVQAEEGYSGMLRSIRRANDRIADPELSRKIDRLEEVAGRIFKTIENQPAKQQKAATFLSYYLPTTQKLLDSYADFEEAGVSGENLTRAKEQIRQTMDNVVAGFEHQLDELYRDTAMDIDSDIRVMETMLRRDGASAASDFGLDGGTAVQSDDSQIE